MRFDDPRPMTLLDHIRIMASYNAWANTRVYDAAAALPEADYRADRGAFFRSVHGTLNHLLVTDRVWMGRFTGETPPPLALDAILFEDRAAIRAARETEDRRIVAFAAGLTPSDLESIIRFRRVSAPESYEQGLGAALVHLFNHQTHHRGQIHAVLTGLEAEAPELDLLVYQRIAGVGARRVEG